MPRKAYPFSVLVERFWAKANQTPTCWVWTKATDKDGYGVAWDGKRSGLKAHRFAWELTNGPIPAGLSVLHHCDTPACIRPSHLFLGTSADNNADKAAKQRAPRQRGELCGTHKIDTETVHQIRRLYASGVKKSYATGNLTQRAIGERFGISQTQVGRIVRGTRWGHI